VPETILVIDDNPDDAELLELSLRRLRIINPIQYLESAIEAVAYLRGDGIYSDRATYPIPKIILLDLRMPSMDGFDFLKWLSAGGILEQFSVFAVSGLDDLAAIRRAYKMGATSFLVKPSSDADLQNLICGYPSHWTQAPLPSNHGPLILTL
jgi:CheY-like chemotaxis protein